MTTKKKKLLSNITYETITGKVEYNMTNGRLCSKPVHGRFWCL